MVIYVVAGNLYSAYSAGKQYGDNAKRPPLFGLYNVDYFVKNKDTLPPLTTDTLRWSKFIVSQYEGNAQVNYMNDSLKYFAIKTDTVKHRITFNSYTDTIHKFGFTYTVQKPGILVINGKWKQDSLHIKLRRYNEKDFLLLKRGFHWVNEYPLNR